MQLFKVSGTATGLALVALYAIGSGFWVSTANTWYRSLRAPSWQPPDWVFGTIWPYNFLVLAVATVLVNQRLTHAPVVLWLVLFAGSVISALTWAYQFYRPHNFVGATIALALAALFTLPLLAIAYKASLLLCIALIPYQLWLITAAALSLGYQRLN